jgi:hypothetical protein
MSSVSSSFSLREFLQLVFPQIIALCLFAPFYSPLDDKVTIEGVLFAGLVLGLLFSSPVDAASKFCARWIPWYRSREKEAIAELSWTRDSLNLERLDAYLTKDDHERIDVVNSLAICYRQTAVFLLIYILWNGCRLIRTPNLSQDVQSWWSGLRDSFSIAQTLSIWQAITAPTTPMLGNWSLPTIVAIAAALLVMPFLLNDSLKAMRTLFGAKGMYNDYAFRYQEKDPDIARAIWGKVFMNEAAWKNIMVVLTISPSAGDSTTQTTQTDSYGLFSFPLVPADRTKYDVSVDDQTENANLERKKICCLLVRRTTKAKKQPLIGRIIFGAYGKITQLSGRAASPSAKDPKTQRLQHLRRAR